MSVLIDLTGKKFGRLTVLRREGSCRSGSGSAPLWVCRCACKKEIEVRGSSLRNGDTRSCGCLQLELVSALFVKHRMWGSPTYLLWGMMNTRCLNPNATGYEDYGGRGITVCKRWSDKKHGFENFLKDMGIRPEGKTLDRENNDKGYSPSNCSWRTPKQQANNRRQRRAA
jgi:hypothetical protein